MTDSSTAVAPSSTTPSAGIFSPVFDDARGLWRELHKLRDAGARFFDRKLFQKRTDRHDPGYFASRKYLSDHNRSNKGHGYEHVGLDVKAGPQTNGGLLHNRNAAQDDRQPRRINRDFLAQAQHACSKGNARDDEKKNRTARIGVNPLRNL